MIANGPGAVGVNVTEQDAVPSVAVAASVHARELPNDPTESEVKLTWPVGVVAPLDAVSVTVAVHVVGLSMPTEVGEHATAVLVGSGAGAEPRVN